MGWLGRLLTSSIGQKLIMSLTGVFLILFLTVHLIGNLQLLIDDQGMAFNEYADFMGHNTLVQIISKGNFFFILLHGAVGLYLWVVNRAARGGQKYAVNNVRAASTHPGFARNMAILGTIMLVFILIHLFQFWLQVQIDNVAPVSYGDGVEINNLYEKVTATFVNPGFVIFYVISMIVISFHLWHGFQSAFQTLGLNHQKYTPIIQFLGKAYSILIPLGFAIIPIVFYLKHA